MIGILIEALGAGLVAVVLVAAGRAMERYHRRRLNTRYAVHRRLTRMQQAPDRW